MVIDGSKVIAFPLAPSSFSQDGGTQSSRLQNAQDQESPSSLDDLAQGASVVSQGQVQEPQRVLTPREMLIERAVLLAQSLQEEMAHKGHELRHHSYTREDEKKGLLYRIRSDAIGKSPRRYLHLGITTLRPRWFFQARTQNRVDFFLYEAPRVQNSIEVFQRIPSFPFPSRSLYTGVFDVQAYNCYHTQLEAALDCGEALLSFFREEKNNRPVREVLGKLFEVEERGLYAPDEPQKKL